MPGGKFLFLLAQEKKPKEGHPAFAGLRLPPLQRGKGTPRVLSPSVPPRRRPIGGEKRRALSELRSGPRRVRPARASCTSAPASGRRRGPPRRGGTAGSPFFGSFLWRDKERNLPPGNPRPPPAGTSDHVRHHRNHAYWQASQVGSSMAQNFTSVAGSEAAAAPAMPPCAGTALSSPPRPVDFSADVAPRVRR